NARQHDVLVDVGEIAGVKRVLIVHVRRQRARKSSLEHEWIYSMPLSPRKRGSSSLIIPILSAPRTGLLLAAMSGLAAHSTATHRRHNQLIAAAAAFGDFRTVMKVQIFRQAKPHLGQTLAVTADRNRAWRQPRIGLYEGLCGGAWSYAERLFEIGIFGWNLHRGACLADRFEISARR